MLFKSIFAGHGSPTSFLDDPIYVQGLQAIRPKLINPKCIIVVSAHFQTDGLYFTNNLENPLIYDFYGFPQEMYQIQYQTQGYPQIENELKNIFPNNQGVSRGLDHGSWSVLKVLFPEGNVPIVGFSLDANLDFSGHYKQAKKLWELTNNNYLIVTSGNITHNLGKMDFAGNSTSNWASEFKNKITEAIVNKDLDLLLNPYKLGEIARLAVPTQEHYLPLLYSLGNLENPGKIEFFNDYFQYGTISMTGVLSS